MRRGAGVFKNIFASMLPQIVNIITNLIVPALIIGLYGSKINGLISTVKNIISYISLVGAGLATAVTQQLYAPVAKNDDETVKGMLNSASKMFFRCGIIFCVILIVVAVVYPFFVDREINYLTVLLLMIVMGLSGASEFFVVGRCRALLYANQKVYVCTIIQAISLIISLILSIVMIKLKASIVLVQLSISLVYVSRAVFLQLYAIKKYPQYKNYNQSQPINSAVSKKNDAMIHQLTGLVVMGSQSLILTFIVGLEAASIYAVYNIVFAGITSVCANVNTAITPFLGRGAVVDSKETLKYKYDLTELFFNVITTFVFSVAAVMLIPFISLYTRGADINYISNSFAVLFVLTFAFHVARLPSSSLINVVGHFKETKWQAIIEAVICVVVSISATLIWGKNGVLIGTGVALCWRALDMIIYSNKKILNRSPIKSVFRLFRAVVIVFIACLISLKLNLLVSSYLYWILYAIIVSICVFLITITETLIFEFKIFKTLIKRLKKK